MINENEKAVAIIQKSMNCFIHETLRILEDAIDRNSENLRFGSEFTMEEFIDECMEEFAEALMAEGLTGEDIRAMAVTNPRWLLGKE